MITATVGRVLYSRILTQGKLTILTSIMTTGASSDRCALGGDPNIELQVAGRRIVSVPDAEDVPGLLIDIGGTRDMTDENLRLGFEVKRTVAPDCDAPLTKRL